jgi:hypothetical protein
LRTSNNDELDFSPAQIGRGELVTFLNEPIVQYESDFSSGVDGWTDIRGTSTAPVNNVSDGTTTKNNTLRFVGNNEAAVHQIRRLSFLSVGNRYHLSGKAYAPLTNSTVTRISCATVAAGATQTPVGGSQLVTNVAGEWTDFEWDFIAVDDQLRIRLQTSTGAEGVNMDGETVFVKDIVITQLTANGRTPILYDWSGNGINATQTTVAEQPFIATAGVLEEGLRFAGGQWLDTGSETIGDGLFAAADRRWTVSFWGRATTQGTFIARASSGMVSTRNFQILNATATGDPLTVIIRGITTNLDPAISPDGVWRNFTVTWDGTTPKVYVNGAFYQNLTTGTATEETGQRIIIGARTNGTGFLLGAGNIAFVGIWNRAITPAEIETVYNLTDPR